MTKKNNLITEVNLPETISEERGLGKIRLNKLESIVPIVGPNGAGKSRLLDLLKEGLLNAQIEDPDTGIIKILKDFVSPDFKSSIDINKWLVLSDDGIPHALEPAIENDMDNPEHINGASKNGFNFEQEKILKILNALISTRKSRLSEEELKYLSRVTDYIKKYIDPNLSYQGNILSFCNQEADDLKVKPLSDGQRRLFLLVGLLSIAPKDQPIILFMDEPSAYLHPKIAVEILRSFLENFDSIQIFMATHDLTLLAALGCHYVVHVDDGVIEQGHISENERLNALLGGMEDIQAIADLMYRPDRRAARKFGAECLLPPETIPAKKNDPQIQQVASEVFKKIKNGDTVRLLDFGAGKGRMVTLLFDNLLSCKLVPSDKTANQLLSYHAYDPYPDDECLNSIGEHYDTAKGRFYNKFNDVYKTSKTEDTKFDYVLMVNVLHEVSPLRWRTVLEHAMSVLKPEGALLIVEDLHLPIGEHAHDEGFIILEPDAMIQLFEGNAIENDFHADPRYKERLVRYLIPQNSFSHVSGASVYNAITEQSKISLNHLDDLRKQNTEKKNLAKLGQKIAFHSMQHANCDLALRKLSEQ